MTHTWTVPVDTKPPRRSAADHWRVGRYLLASVLFPASASRSLTGSPNGISFSTRYGTLRLESRCAMAWLVSLCLLSLNWKAGSFILLLLFSSAIFLLEVCSSNYLPRCPGKPTHFCYVCVPPRFDQKVCISLGSNLRDVCSEINAFIRVSEIKFKKNK